MFTPEILWPIVAFSSVVVFKAGTVIEKIRNDKYRRIDTCDAKHVGIDKVLEGISTDIKRIIKHMEG